MSAIERNFEDSKKGKVIGALALMGIRYAASVLRMACFAQQNPRYFDSQMAMNSLQRLSLDFGPDGTTPYPTYAEREQPGLIDGAVFQRFEQTGDQLTITSHVLYTDDPEKLKDQPGVKNQLELLGVTISSDRVGNPEVTLDAAVLESAILTLQQKTPFPATLINQLSPFWS